MFFVDIQGFSAFCRGRSPVEVCDLLNPYFEMASQAIQGHGGHVDKFIGDGVMGIFGAAPIDDPRLGSAGKNPAAEAVLAGRELIERWTQWSAGRWKGAIPLRVGINTGRIEYSALGDTVNLASRLEHLAPPNGVAISEATRCRLGRELECVSLGEVDIRGCSRGQVWRIAP